MPIPRKQLEQLRVDLHNHEKELKELETSRRKDQPDVRARIEFHKSVLKVARDPKILKVLEDLHDEPELAGQMAGDPEAFARTRGIRLPSGATKIVLLGRAPQPVAVGMDFHLERIRFRLEWGAESGFTVRQLPDSA